MNRLADLKRSLAGVYRFGNHFSVFPQPGVRTEEVLNHEWTHFVLATSTYAGLIHQIVACLAYQYPGEHAVHWEEVYSAALDATVGSHEGTATYAGLAEGISSSGVQQATEDAKLPPEYREWIQPLSNVVPSGLSPFAIRLIVGALADHAFNIPVQAYRQLSWKDVRPGSNWRRWLPPTDDRWHRLLALSQGRFMTDLSRRLEAKLTSIPEYAHPASILKFLSERRKASSQLRFWLIQELATAFSNDVPVAPADPDTFSRIGTDLIKDFKRSVLESGETRFESFRRDFEVNSDGEDPLLYDVKVLLPPGAHYNLIRIDPAQKPPIPPDIISVHYAAADCVLSDSLTLRKGQLYIRYYCIRAEQKIGPTYYCISAGMPHDASAARHAVLVLTGPDKFLRDFKKPGGLEECVLVRWWAAFSRQFVDHLMESPSDKRFGVANWGEDPNVGTLFIYDNKSRVMEVASAAGAPLEIFSQQLSAVLKPGALEGCETARLVKLIWPLRYELHPRE